MKALQQIGAKSLFVVIHIVLLFRVIKNKFFKRIARHEHTEYLYRAIMFFKSCVSVGMFGNLFLHLYGHARQSTFQRLYFWPHTGYRFSKTDNYLPYI